MSFHIEYTKSASDDLRQIYLYIAEQLQAPETARQQVRRIMAAIRSLEDLPLRYRMYDEEPWRSRGLRVLPVDRYLVLYLPSEADAAVRIVRIVYGKRDISRQLDQTSC